MRKFLPKLNIIGAMLVSKETDILDYSIPNLLKWSDWILIMFDNEAKNTEQIVLDYQKRYPDKIRIAYTGLPKLTEEQETENNKGLLKRFKRLHGPIRQSVFDYLQDCVKNKNERIDILLWPDADEIFTDSLPELLEKFWAMSDKRAISMRWITVFENMKTIFSKSKGGHTRILKFAMDFTAIPHVSYSHYVPLTKEDRLGCNYVLIHLAQMTHENRMKRRAKWKYGTKPGEPLHTLEKDIREMTPIEIRETLKKKPDLFT